MCSEEKKLILSNEVVLSKIIVVRQQKVTLRASSLTLHDKDLALLYQVETKHLKSQVKRNIEHFSTNFMFELTVEEKKT